MNRLVIRVYLLVYDVVQREIGGIQQQEGALTRHQKVLGR